MDQLISARRPSDSQPKKKKKKKERKKAYRTMDFAVPDNHKVKLKESEKRDNYLDLAIGLKTYVTLNWQ